MTLWEYFPANILNNLKIFFYTNRLYYNGGSGLGGDLSSDSEIVAYHGVYAYQYDIFGKKKTVDERPISKHPEKLD